MEQFEYKSFLVDISKMNQLNTLGDSGWELVHVGNQVRLLNGQTGMEANVNECIFKRKK